MRCRNCLTLLKYNFLDLGFAPFSNAYLNKNDLSCPEYYYPLRVKVCHSCWLVQTDIKLHSKDLFTSKYSYFSSTSISWVLHAKDFFKKITKKLNLNKNSFVIEVASNDGYLLKNFLLSKIPCLGIEPTISTANEAIKKGIPTITKFFGELLAKKLADEGKKADLIIGNNVLAHVPDINDFAKGLRYLLKPEGTITLEFPHLLSLIKNYQFDTIYHEHFSYLSLSVVKRIFFKNGLRIWNVDKIPTHGGSLRVYACHKNSNLKTLKSVDIIIKNEYKQGLEKLKTYVKFKNKVSKIKNDLLLFLINKKKQKKKVMAYGAAAKGNTLLNYAGVKEDLIEYIFDKAKSKQGNFMPGSHIPILSPKKILEKKPDYLLILPWNLQKEIKKLKIFKSQKKIKLVVALPKLKKI